MNVPTPPIKGVNLCEKGHWSGKACADIKFAYCNLRCPWCNAKELVLSPDSLESWALDRVFSYLKQETGKIRAVCATGGEPTMHRGLPRFFREIKSFGFLTCVETNGTQPDVLDYLINEGLINSVLMDVKGPLENSKYSQAVGVDMPTSLIIESLNVLKNSAISESLRTTVVPAILDKHDVMAIARQLQGMGFTSLSLNVYDPAIVLEPDMAGIKKMYSKQDMAQMRTAVNAVFAKGDNQK